MQKTITCGNKKITSAKSYRVIGDNLTSVTYTDECPYQLECEGCYGQIIVLKKENINNSKERTTTRLRNYFKEVNNEIIDYMQVENYLAKNDLIEVVENSSLHKGTIPWVAYDRPVDHETACKKCRQKHKNRFEKGETKVERITPECERGALCTQQKQRKVLIW